METLLSKLLASLALALGLPAITAPTVTLTANRIANTLLPEGRHSGPVASATAGAVTP